MGGDSERWALSLLKPWSGARYVTLESPFLNNTDLLGVADGMMQSAATLASKAIKVKTPQGWCDCLKVKRVELLKKKQPHQVVALWNALLLHSPSFS